MSVAIVTAMLKNNDHDSNNCDYNADDDCGDINIIMIKMKIMIMILIAMKIMHMILHMMILFTTNNDGNDNTYGNNNSDNNDDSNSNKTTMTMLINAKANIPSNVATPPLPPQKKP